jgi:nucleoside-diphosphate-sugar epimerase
VILTRAEEIIGWKQKIQIDEGLEKTYKWVKSKLDK